MIRPPSTTKCRRSPSGRYFKPSSLDEAMWMRYSLSASTTSIPSPLTYLAAMTPQNASGVLDSVSIRTLLVSCNCPYPACLRLKCQTKDSVGIFNQLLSHLFLIKTFYFCNLFIDMFHIEWCISFPSMRHWGCIRAISFSMHHF